MSEFAELAGRSCWACGYPLMDAGTASPHSLVLLHQEYQTFATTRRRLAQWKDAQPRSQPKPPSNFDCG